MLGYRGMVVRIDPRTNRVSGPPIRVGTGAAGIVAGHSGTANGLVRDLRKAEDISGARPAVLPSAWEEGEHLVSTSAG